MLIHALLFLANQRQQQQQSTQSQRIFLHAIDLCVSINYRQTNKLSVIFVCCDASRMRQSTRAHTRNETEKLTKIERMAIYIIIDTHEYRTRERFA